jgi:hypothetical protein
VMLDPSLVVEPRALNRTLSEISALQASGLEFFFPRSFATLDEQVDRRAHELPQFFRPGKGVGLSASRLAMELESAGVHQWDAPTRWASLEFGSFRDDLARGVPDTFVAEILFEEWLFLTQESWLVSRIKAPFKALARAGELGVEVLNPLVRRTLKRDASHVVDTADRLRALSKWMAVGGPVVAGLLNPIAGAIVTPIAGGFLLLDPPRTRSFPRTPTAYPVEPLTGVRERPEGGQVHGSLKGCR